ncbi:MAG: response regulator transcription factor [Culicoidibacterales bacterium]
MANKRVLVIEDETNLARFIELELKFQDFDVDKAINGEEGLEKSLENEYDLILLDWMLPGMQGIDILRELRKTSVTPVIMMTAKEGVENEIEGLDTGADAYITKPFEIDQLLAHVRAVLRRTEKEDEAADGIIHYQDITIYTNRYEVFVGEEKVELTKKEYDLLLLFIRNKGVALDRRRILSEVWGYEYYGETNVVDVYVRYLRSKLNRDYIKTVRGVGYYIE